jgi:hypothetical protein
VVRVKRRARRGFNRRPAKEDANVKRYALAAALLAACAIGLLLYHQPPTAAGAAAAAAQKWEYKQVYWSKVFEAGGASDILHPDDDCSAGLSKLGDEGWELVAVSSTKDGLEKYVFKRAK